MLWRWVLLGAVLVAGSGCISPRPVTEQLLAHVAISSAKEAGADRMAAVLWHDAEREYLAGRRALDDRDNDAARTAFLKSRKFAEDAENLTRLKRFQTGEVVP